MSKSKAKKKQKPVKQQAVETELQQMTEEKQADISEGVVETEKPAKDKKVKDEKKTQKQTEKVQSKDKKKGKKKDKEKKSFGRRVKEIMSELKKVTWPTFPEVVKKTGIVIAFVLIFGIFLFGVNYLLGGLSNLLNGGTWF